MSCEDDVGYLEAKNFADARRKCTTRVAAITVGIGLATLQRWIRAGKIEPPKPRLIGGVGYRFWGEQDIRRLERVKAQIYRKGRGRKAKRKRK